MASKFHPNFMYINLNEDDPARTNKEATSEESVNKLIEEFPAELFEADHMIHELSNFIMNHVFETADEKRKIGN